MDKKTLQHYKTLLLSKREELDKAYREKLSRSEDEGGDGARDSVDEASVNYNKEFWYALSDSDRKILRMVEEALRRADEGTLGECTHCEKPIQKKRLEAVPWAKHCLECQDLQDRGLLRE
jgi:DnaK suppressor protein